jgi:hypothetical protein
VQERGWQEAAREIYPLDINEVKVVSAEVTYRPAGDFQPLHLRDINLLASNIRNIRSRDREYPSELHADAVIFEMASCASTGTRISSRSRTPASIRDPDRRTSPPLPDRVVHDYAQIRKGTFSGNGEIEYAPRIHRVDLETIAIAGADADYVLTDQNYQRSEKLRQETIQQAKEVSNDPDCSCARSRSASPTARSAGSIEPRVHTTGSSSRGSTSLWPTSAIRSGTGSAASRPRASSTEPAPHR